MADSAPKYSLGSPQEHTPMCEKHKLNFDIVCEDCKEFICSECARTDHKDHTWKTIPTAGSLKRRELKNILTKVKKEDVKEMDEKIQKADKLMEDNLKSCDSEVSKLQKHYDAIVSKLTDIKRNCENALKENMDRKNGKVSEKKTDLEKRRKQVLDLVKFLEEEHSSLSDYGLIDNLRDLTSLTSNKDSDREKEDHSVRYRRGDISEGLLKSMMGEAYDLDNIGVTETNSFQYGDKKLHTMEAISEGTCFIHEENASGYIEHITKENKKIKKINLEVNDACVTDNGDLYGTDYDNDSIVRVSPSGSVSTAFSTAPLEPMGICPSADGGLLVTLKDNKSEWYQVDSHSRRLVGQFTLTGDVIREYEYQEDGQTRLFTVPYRVKQNGNTDICVVNWPSKTKGELVILSSSRSLKSVYRGQNQEWEFYPTDVVCDSHCSIIVSDINNSQIHLLSPDGEFMKYLLTENQVTHPYSMSLYKSTLWVGDYHGLVKIFQYKNKN